MYECGDWVIPKHDKSCYDHGKKKDYDYGKKKDCDHGKVKEPCPQLPGTLLRIFIPAGAVINLLNLIEVTSPSGICLIVRLPFLGGACGAGMSGILDSIKKAGGSVEFVNG